MRSLLQLSQAFWQLANAPKLCRFRGPHKTKWWAQILGGTSRRKEYKPCLHEAAPRTGTDTYRKRSWSCQWQFSEIIRTLCSRSQDSIILQLYKSWSCSCLWVLQMSQSPHLKKNVVEAEKRNRAAKTIKGKKLFYKRLKKMSSVWRKGGWGRQNSWRGWIKWIQSFSTKSK